MPVASTAGLDPEGYLPPHYHRTPMSTRKLILLALACGLALLVAFAAQLFMATR